MFRSAPIAVLLLLLFASPAAAQAEWSPPDRRMPSMPTAAELDGDWLGPRGAWFGNLRAATGVAASDLRATGEPRDAAVARIARFQNGPLPIVLWTDRNGDGIADAVEIYRDGGLIAQLIDSDQDGSANVLRRYDGSGVLIREDRM